VEPQEAMERRWNLADVIRCHIMSGFKEKLGPKQEAAVLALLSSRNVEEAARVVGVTSKTLYRWMKEPAFDAAYREAKRAAFSQSIARLHQMTTAAVTTIGKVMLDSSTPPATKVRAADSILNHMTKAIEIEDIEARVSELERAAEEAKRNR
jgi:transposase-like protein